MQTPTTLQQQKNPVIVVISGAAGQISYSLLFRIAAGEMLGKDQPIILRLLETSFGLKYLKGLKMELYDGAYPLLQEITIHSSAESACQDAQYAILIGAMPRSVDMERVDLLQENANIFSVQGKAIDKVAAKDIKVLVVGNPANTNCLIAATNAPSIKKEQFSCMMRLDHNRASSMLAYKLQISVTQISNMAIWGNHSTTQYPCLQFTQVNGQSIFDSMDLDWYENTFIPSVANRGAEIIKNRDGKSSTASAAQAIIDHMRAWVLGSNGQWTSMGVISDGSYGIPKDIVCSFPVVCANGTYSIVPDLQLNDFSKKKIKESADELLAEKDAVQHLL